MENKIIVAPSPHIQSDQTVEKLMYGVIIALFPAFLVSIYFFGLPALLLTLIAIFSCVVFEFVIAKYLLKQVPTVKDGSAILTGILLAFNVPSNLPVWMLVLGCLMAIGIGKMTFGGLGNNLFNPALVGRVFLLISFPVQMTTWPLPLGLNTKYFDAATGPTALGVLKEGIRNGSTVSQIMAQVPTHMQMFLGKMGGSLGEVAAGALLLGFIYLLYKKIISWHIPVSILLTITIFTGILWVFNPQTNADPLFHLLTGGVMLGAIFMATDYVTSPMSKSGMLIFGVGIGILTVVIRRFGAYPEGVSFAILIMNAFVPLINRYIKPKRFGEEVRRNG
jgi:Na+-translocating ferredoxin:NAD+ oxidoreductase subunit D